MLREVKLYGFLGKRFGKMHKLDVASPAEAVRALCALFPDFKRMVCMFEGKGFAVFADNVNLGDMELKLEYNNTKSFRIVPILEGAGSDGIGSIIAGVLLIAAAIFTYGAAAAAATAAYGSAATVTGTGVLVAGSVFISSAAMAKMGVALILSGAVQLLSKPKKTSSQERADNSSDLFTGAQNVTAEGVPIPLVYGRFLVGSVVASLGFDTWDAPPRG